MTTAYSGDGITFPDNSAQATAPKVGMVNRVINGDMRIDQRNAGASVTTAFAVDRWRPDTTNQATFTYQRNGGSVTPPTGFTNYLGITSTSAYTPATNTTSSIAQGIEGVNVSDLEWGTSNAQTVTLSFWVRSSLTGTHSGAVVNGGANNRSYVFSFAISSSNTWEQKSVTISGDTTGTWPTDNTAGMYIRFNLGTGAGTYASITTGWQVGNIVGLSNAVQVSATNGATFYVTGVQLEKGSTATDFEYVDYSRQLQMCQRYYNIWSGTTAPSTGLATCMATGGTVPCSRRVSWSNPVEFRAQPTLSTGGTIQLYTFGLTNLVFTGFNSNFSRKNIVSFDANSTTSGTGGQCLWLIIDSTSSANYIAASAEL